ncbi:MAG: cytochrome ubiquinol oxidase subunit I [Thermoanaerobaculales bacterium]
MDYPIWSPALGGGVLIGIVAIAHVLVSHFAIGGGLAIAWLETLSVRRNDAAMRSLAKRSSLMLILVSTVFGAISGVGIWVTIGLVQPAATSALIHNFVWGWAAEWGFFILEVATALAYWATWDKVRPRAHLLIIWLYFFAAYMSLVIIQGILSFMLTPGRWVATHSFWDAIFNPSYLPGLVLRTGICLLLAGAYLTLAALRERDTDARTRLVRILAVFQVVGALLAYGGYRWWEAVLPGQVRAIFSGVKPLLPALVATRHFVLWGLTAFLLVVLFALLAPRLHRWPTAVLAMLAAFAFFAGYERLREGARKPFVIRDYMFSNGILVNEIADLNQRGVLAKATWAAGGARSGTAVNGAAVFHAECASCHTLDGYLSIRRLVAPVDPDMVRGILSAMQAEGDEYTAGRYVHDGHFQTQKLDYPLMPPLVGTQKEVDALGDFLLSLKPSHVAEVGHAD